MLPTLIDLLGEQAKAELARKCLTRYTEQSLGSIQAWQQWFKENEKCLIFSDRGGYCFFEIPELK